MAVADFNRDGNADIVAANTNGDTLTLLLGDGTGNFVPAPASPINLDTSVLTVVSGDVNGDGNPDLVAGGGTVVVLLGDGAGNFTKGAGIVPSNYFIGASLLVLADFNGDGKLDLIPYSSGASTLLFGDGTGGFGPPHASPLTTVSPVGSVVAADFNGDGKMDLAALPWRGTNMGTVFTGDGTGRLQRVFNFLGSVAAIDNTSAAADFNGDGKTDILTFMPWGEGGDAQTWAWTGEPVYTFKLTQTVIPAIPSSVITADFNGDGKADWAGINPGLGTVTVSLGDGTGKFTAASGNPFAVGVPPVALASGDFNGDGQADLAINTGSAVVILLNAMSSPPATGPVIAPGGVVPLFSSVTEIQPGEWGSIYGTNLGSTATWNGDFPTSLGGTSVTINGKPAYLWYVSPTQINFQAPDDDTPPGPVPVVVKTTAGSALSVVNLVPAAPSFSVIGGKYVAGIILRPDGSGAYGGGEYDIIGPTGNSLGYPTVAAKAGDSIELFAVGLGPTASSVPAGRPFTGSVPTIPENPVIVYINNIGLRPNFAGLSSAGLYQINLVVPAGLGTGDVPITASVGDGSSSIRAQTSSKIFLPLQ